jgi:adenylate cyclase
MPFLFDRLYRRMGRFYILVFGLFDALSALVICLATVGLFALYTAIPGDAFWESVLFAEAAVLVALALTAVKAAKQVAPITSWIRQGKGEQGAFEAWRTAVAFPRDYIIQNGWQPFLIVAGPIAIYFTIRFDLPFYSAAIIFAGALVAVGYAAVLAFFAAEMFLRPVVEDICDVLPRDFAGMPAGVPLRWKLLGALPIINIVTGVVVAGLSTNGSASLNDLGVDVVVAVLVAFTISLELTVLLTKSVLRPVEDLLEATRRVKEGDLDARVRLTSGDEMGTLEASFNEMMDGLSEREALREAFGSYVDPAVAERVLEEGELLEGRELEVTVMFVDIRDFTPFAERSSARETVAFLNEFFDLVVPVVLEHGGHADKFLGDGLLAVFGAPERASDHADRALEAACAIVRATAERFDGRLEVGIGLNSGPVVVGSVGGGGRLEFTVIGDPVNVAARVEKATRDSGDPVLITEATRCLLERMEVELEPRGEVPLKGKSDPVSVYAPRGLDEGSTSERPPLTAEA